MQQKLKMLGVILLTAAALAGCSGKMTGDTYPYSSDEIPVRSHVKAEDAVIIPEWKGLKLNQGVPQKVTEQDAREYAMSALVERRSLEKNEAAQRGDTVLVDYEGTLDGVAFTGGTAADQYITIGEGGYVEGFEEGLVGVRPGEEKDVTVTFPDGYSEELGGKDTVFHFVVKEVTRPQEPTEEQLKEAREYLEKQSIENAQKAVEGQAWGLIEDGVKYYCIPQALIDASEKEFETQCEYSFESVEKYKEHFSFSDDDYENEKSKYGKDTGKYYTLIEAMAKDMSIADSDPDYATRYETLKEQYAATDEEMSAKYGDEQIRCYVFSRMIIDKILAAADYEETDTQSASEPAAETITETNSGSTAEEESEETIEVTMPEESESVD